jgi:LysM repeat protein
VYDDPAATKLSLSTGQPDVQPGAGSAGIGRSGATGEGRSPNAWVCPFLRAIDQSDALGMPVEAPDPANRCAALHAPVPQSLRQQELVCLTSGHVNCPRYLRGAVGVAEHVEQVERVERSPGTRTVTPATAGALAAFALAFLVSVGFVIANGGLALTAASAPSPSGGVLGEIETAAPTAAPTVVPTPTAAPTPLISPSPSPTPSASPTPTATPTSTPTPTLTPTSKPTSGRYALLTPCRSTPDCYVYVIRSGDNLYSIANYFGVSLTRIQRMNPWVKNGLVVGRALRIPTPTR